MNGLGSFGYESRIRAVLVGLAVTVLALTVAQLATIPVFVLDSNMLSGELAAASRSSRIIFLMLNFLGMAGGGAFYLWVTGRSLDWIDLRLPTTRDLLWTVGGIILVFAYYVGFNAITFALDLPTADSDVVLLLGDDIVMILAMIAIVFLFNAPAEEFVFRNVIQKRLYDSFSGHTSVLLASLIFAVVHIPVFLVQSPSPAATGVAIGFLFGGSIVFGYVYLRTQNLLVPIAVHALLNGFVLTLYLLAVVLGMDAELQSGASAIAGVHR